MTTFNPFIFKEYDIRGLAFNEVSKDLAYKVGYFFAKMHVSSKNNSICVGYDTRPSSLSLYESLLQGLRNAGAAVISIGVAPTPLLYFADYKFRPAASIMITASHNPDYENGFKLIAGSAPFYGSKLQDLHRQIKLSESETENQNTTYFLETNERQDVKNLDLSRLYIDRIMQNMQFKPDIKIAWDLIDSAACKIVRQIIEILPCKSIVIDKACDQSLQGVVRANKCDLGIAFDKDADRLIAVSDEGIRLTGDELICIFAEDILANNPNKNIVIDIKISQMTINQIKSYRGNPVISKTGHVFIKEKIKELNAIFGGELSGHFFFADKYYGYDDGIYSALRLIELIANSMVKLSEMAKSLPQAFLGEEIRVNIKDNQKFIIINKIKSKLKKEGTDFDDLDGIKVIENTYSWLIRASNTENVISIRCEASSKKELYKIETYVKRLINGN